MPFQKGNQLGKANANQDANKRGQWNNIVGWLVGNGGTKFQEAMTSLANGIDIPKPQKEFIEYYIDLLEFHQPKLGRQSVDLDVDGKIEFIVKKLDDSN